MRSIIAVCLVGFACASSFCQNKDIETIKKLNSEWLKAYVTKDSHTLSTIFADDFILINPIGGKVTKADAIGNLHRQETLSVKIDSVDVRLVTENVGILTAYTTFVLKIDGKEVPGRNCYQDVYLKRKNNWLAISAHVTLLSPK
jgi:uncharacterized protein (TIGR02246 family)